MKDDDRDQNMDEKKKTKFKIVDRRRIDPDEIEASDAPLEPKPRPQTEPEPTPPQAAKEIEEELHDSHGDGKPDEEAVQPNEDPFVYQNILLSILQTLMTIAWVHLGLVPHPQTKLVTKRLEQANKAINLFELIYRNSLKDISPQINQELERVLMEMKAAYVNQL